MSERDVMRDLREMNPVPHTAEPALDARAGVDLHRILAGDLQPGDPNPTAPGRPGMRRARIGGLALVLVAGGSAAAYAAVGGGSGTPTPLGPNPPADKQAIQQAYDAQRASAAAPAPKDPAANAAAAASLMNQPDPTPPTGIQDTHEGPFSPAQFAVANKWQGEVNGNWVEVYAGEIQADPDGSNAAAGKPGLRVQVFKGAWNGTLLGSTDYQVPGTTGGSAKITGQSNNVLTVVSSDGTQSKFDMTTDTVH